MKQKPITVTCSIFADRSMVYTRVVNTILSELPDDYEHFDDVFELREIAEQLDLVLRRQP